jgi:hypothetical protein
MREYMVVWRDNDTYDWHYQDNGNATKFYFAMPLKSKLLRAINEAPTSDEFSVSDTVILWSKYFGFNTNKELLDQHDANPAVDHSGAGAAPRG